MLFGFTRFPSCIHIFNKNVNKKKNEINFDTDPRVYGVFNTKQETSVCQGRENTATQPSNPLAIQLFRKLAISNFFY